MNVRKPHTGDKDKNCYKMSINTSEYVEYLREFNSE